MPLSKVAIVGRSNVGKSTFFNTICEQNRALVFPIAGTTRDRLEAEVSWRGKKFILVDSGGIDPSKNDPYSKEIIKQSETAQKEASLVLILADVTTGPLQEDINLLKKIRKSEKKFILVINKCDNSHRRSLAREFKKLSEELFTISAKNGSGVGDLLDEIVKITEKNSEEEKYPDVTIALTGKPNVGKSSLFNNLAKSERMIVSETPHTTRDSQDIDIIDANGKKFRIIDTAGIPRRSNKKNSDVEELSIGKTRDAANRSDVVALTLDISKSFTSQDKRLGKEIEDLGKGIIIVANKWDLIPEKESSTIQSYENYITKYFPNLYWAPIIFISALFGQRTNDILSLALEVKQNMEREITENALSVFIKKIVSKRKPTIGKGTRRPRILRMIQSKTKPPTFIISIPTKTNLASSYLKYISSSLRESFNFSGASIKIIIEEKEIKKEDEKNNAPQERRHKRVTHRRRPQIRKK